MIEVIVRGFPTFPGFEPTIIETDAKLIFLYPSDFRRLGKRKKKRWLYYRAGGRCEHPGGCTYSHYPTLTIDHLTPKCLARIWGWPPTKVNDLSNLQLLCPNHHRKKDRPTPAMIRDKMSPDPNAFITRRFYAMYRKIVSSQVI